MPEKPKAIRISPNQYPEIIAKIPANIKAIFIACLKYFLILFSLNKNAANGGIKNKATSSEAINAKVFVKAKGLNNFPSAPIIVKTGIKLIIVVSTAVIIAPDTSVVALYTILFIDFLSF